MPAWGPALKREYEALFAAAAIRPEWRAEIDHVVDRILAPAALARYREVERATGVPAHLVGIIHMREASGSFRTHLHNGDPLSARTWHVPAGRPPRGEPPFGWAESAIDALTMPGQALDRWDDWSVGGIAYVLERYNGFGYRYRGVNSPYLWGHTTAYERGLYVADGSWSPTAVNKNPGGLALLKRMIERGLVPAPAAAGVDFKVNPAPARLLCTREIQAALAKAGIDPGPIDGILGPRTRDALARFLRG